MARQQSVREQIDIVKQSTLAATQALLVATAKAAHAKVMATDPRPVTFQRFVDGSEGAPEEAVKPFGVIVYEYPRLNEVALFALETLRSLSPVGSARDPHPGAYRDGHRLYLNGQAVDDLSTWHSGDDVCIMNFAPYARKIEVGNMAMKVPGTDHVYQQAQQLISARQGNLAKVTFEWRGLLSGGYTLVGQFRRGVGAHARTGLRKDTSAGASMTYPALIIAER